MKNYRRISLTVLFVILSIITFSLCSFAEGATEQKVVCTYDKENGVLTANIYVSKGTAIVGYCSFDYDQSVLTLLDSDRNVVPTDVPSYAKDGKTLYLKNIFESHGGIVVTDIGNGTKKLINTVDGYAMFAWYFSDSNSVIDAQENEVLISSVKFQLNDSKTVSDINENTLVFASAQITDKVNGWYPAIFVMDKDHKQYSYTDGTLKADIIFSLPDSEETLPDSEPENPDDNNEEENKNTEENTQPENKEDNTDSPSVDPNEDEKASDNEDANPDDSDASSDTTTPEGNDKTESGDNISDNTQTGNQNDKEENPPQESKPDDEEPDSDIYAPFGVVTEHDFGLESESTETTLRLKWNKPDNIKVEYYTLKLTDDDGNAIRVVDGISSVTGSYTIRDIAHSFTYLITLSAFDENANEYVQKDFEAKTLRFEGTPQMLSYTVTYDAGDGYIYGFPEEYVLFGSTARKAPEVIAPEGLYFAGWSQNRLTPIDTESTRLYSDTTYYAIYTDAPDAYINGYISGYDDGTFKPGGTLNRAESAALFARVAGGYSKDGKYENSFIDVDSDDWFESVVAFCCENGYMSGYVDGSFRPMNTISRAEFVTVVCRMFGFEASQRKDHYSDISSHWSRDYVNALYENCSKLPFNESTFQPDKKITRREAVLVLNAALGIVPDKDAIIDYVRENGNLGRIFGDISLSDPDFFEIAAAAIGKQK